MDLVPLDDEPDAGELSGKAYDDMPEEEFADTEVPVEPVMIGEVPETVQAETMEPGGVKSALQLPVNR